MWRRPVSVLCAVLGCVAVGVFPLRPIAAAGECLIAPRAGTPKGQHWRYRGDRQCWYLQRDVPPAAPTAAAADVPLPARRPIVGETALPGSIADAHDELPRPQAVLPEDAARIPMGIHALPIGSGPQAQYVAPTPPQPMPGAAEAASDASMPAQSPISPGTFSFMVFVSLLLSELAASTLFPLWRARGQRRPRRRAERYRARPRADDRQAAAARSAPATPAPDRLRAPLDRNARFDQVERLLAQLANRPDQPVNRRDSGGGARMRPSR